MPPPGAFDDLCAAAGGGVRAGECRRATGGARALFSTRAFARDDVVFREIPALLVQDPRNVASARACARCHALLDETPTPTACAQGCGVTYCDERCASEHFSSGGHRIACVGPLESYSHPVAALKLACAKDDDGDGLLALLTETVARCVARAEEDAAEEDGREPPGEGGGGFLRRAGRALVRPRTVVAPGGAAGVVRDARVGRAGRRGEGRDVRGGREARGVGWGRDARGVGARRVAVEEPTERRRRRE